MIPHRSLTAGCLLITALLAGGCRSPQYLERTESGGVSFEQFHAEYDFEEPIRQLTRGFDSNPQSIVDSEVEAVSWKEEWSFARLEIDCPNPAGERDVAQVTLTLKAPGPNGRGERTEKRLLAVPREQIDLLILDLAQSGFFDQTLRSSGAANLAVRIDQGRSERSWKHDGRLLDFAHRTLTRGAVLPAPQRSARPENMRRGKTRARS